MKNALLIILILAVFSGCRNSSKYADGVFHKIDTLNTLTTNNWNLIVPDSDTNLFNKNHQPLYFKNGYAYFSNQRISEYTINQDTLILIDTSFIITNKPDSFITSTKTFLVGLIKKISSDSLVIKKVKGYGLPFYFNEIYRFYNDTIKNYKSFEINKISYSTGACFGNCPITAIEIKSNGQFKYFGGTNSDLKGFYKGQLNNNCFNEIVEKIYHSRILSSDESLLPPIDAPPTELIIEYNNSKRKKIIGYEGDFTPRLRELTQSIKTSIQCATINEVTQQLNFDTEVHKPYEIPPPPPPPIKENTNHNNSYR